MCAFISEIIWTNNCKPLILRCFWVLVFCTKTCSKLHHNSRSIENTGLLWDYWIIAPKPVKNSETIENTGWLSFEQGFEQGFEQLKNPENTPWNHLKQSDISLRKAVFSRTFCHFTDRALVLSFIDQFWTTKTRPKLTTCWKPLILLLPWVLNRVLNRFWFFSQKADINFH